MNGGAGVRWDGAALVAVDQTALPVEFRELRLTTVDDVVDAIRRLAVRGAAAIGVAGAFGVVLAVHRRRGPGGALDAAAVRADCDRLAEARPTAATLRWAVDRVAARLPEGPAAVEAEARAVLADDERTNRSAATRAAQALGELCPDRPLRLLTHCNTGELATGGGGTALGAIRVLADRGRVREVLATETRPLLQGARLTVWELRRAGVPHRLCVDSAGPAALAAGMVDAVVVGADRVAANGDVANKVGTYSLACAAARAGVPFVVVAPRNTVDAGAATGAAFVIEERAAAEVTSVGGVPTSVPGVATFNPAFDVTPAELVTALVDEGGVRTGRAVPVGLRPAA